MNTEMKKAFSCIKPVCDKVMVMPTMESIETFTKRVKEIKVEALQELQQYMLFPFITHIKSEEMDKRHDLQSKMAEAMKVVLERVTINSFEMCMKIETALLGLVFDNSKKGMVAEVPEELKLTVMQCLTTLMLKLEKTVRETLLKTQVPTIAQAVFVSVHIAKLDKLRTLRLSALDCLTAHLAVHSNMTDFKYHISDPCLDLIVVDTLSHILPGVLAALQDVATDPDNPGHAVVVSAIEATHRILCVTMSDRHKPRAPPPTPEDFTKLYHYKKSTTNNELLPKRSAEWYAMAGEKISVVVRSIVTLSAHEHYKVRKELAILCYRILDECSLTMQPSLPTALDVLICLSKDDYPEVSQYCQNAVKSYLSSSRIHTMEGLSDNFFAILISLPRVWNNVDSTRKLSALNLLYGYIEIMCSGAPQLLTTALTAKLQLHNTIDALHYAAAMTTGTSLAQHATRDVTSPPPSGSPWCKLQYFDTPALEQRFKDIIRLFGDAEISELLADRLIELFYQDMDCETVFILNWMAVADNAQTSLIRRLLDMYIEESIWYLPLEVGTSDAPITKDETLDVSVYNPRAWSKDSVPDLYEGTVETRYTDISYKTPRLPPKRDPNTCATLAEAHKNMVLSCLLTEGVGIMALRMKHEYQQYLLKTLCMVLERIGSKYEMLHLAGLKALNQIAQACGYKDVPGLIKKNADYFTHEVTVRLKKAWNCQTALQILSVVMEFSDPNILDCLYGIVEDVLVQSCDKYYEKNLESYLQVFLTFTQCIKKWFQIDAKTEPKEPKMGTLETKIDLLHDLKEYMKNKEECEKLLSSEVDESSVRAEDMYKEDAKRREDDLLDYDDTVTKEKPPLPQHIKVTITILKRCVNFISSPNRNECILALQTLSTGFTILRSYEDELLPLVHQTWAPLVGRFEVHEPVVQKKAFELLVVMADVSKDFIRNRTVKEVLPHIYKYLQKSSLESYLKDAGSAYRNSHAYSLQEAELAALSRLVVDLSLDDERLTEAMASVSLYLSNKQPKPLQASAVEFFKTLLHYDYGATWHYLRKVCNNDKVLVPPKTPLPLKQATGTPYEPTNKDSEVNMALIW